MSHLDEGMLHTLLDGEATAEQATAWRAHLAACDACASRLAEEAALRVRARAALDAVLPDPIVVAIPTGRGRRWRAPLAWAATVLVAVGAGWLMRGAWPGGSPAGAPADEAATELTASPPAAAPAGESPAPTSGPYYVRIGPAQPSSSAAAVSRDRSGPATPSGRSAEKKAEQEARADAAAPAPAPAIVATVPLVENVADERARVQAASGMRAAEAPARQAAPDVDAAARALGGSLRRLEGATLAGVVTEGGAAVSRWRLADGVVVVLRQEAQRGLATGDTLLREADRRASARWRDGDYELTLEGPIPSDSLLRLARRVH